MRAVTRKPPKIFTLASARATKPNPLEVQDPAPITGTVAETRSLSWKFLRDTWLIFQRQMQLMLRNPVWLIVGIIQPLFYLLLFAPLLKPALVVKTNAEAYELFHSRHERWAPAAQSHFDALAGA